MKSLQLFIGVICLGVFIGYSSALNELTINHIVIDADYNVKICFFSTYAIDAYNTFYLDIADLADSGDPFFKPISLSKPSMEGDLLCTSCTTNPCLSKDELDELVNDETEWMLAITDQEEKDASDQHQRNLEPALFGLAKIIMPDILPVPSLTEDIHVIGASGSGEKILKFKEGFTKLLWNNEILDLESCTTPPNCYYKTNLDSSKSLEFMNCAQEGDSLVPLCGGSLLGKAITEEDLTRKTVIMVDYTASPSIVSFTMDGIKYEEVIDLRTPEACTSLTKCPSPPTGPDLDYYDIKFVHYEDPKQFQDDQVRNREVNVYELTKGSGAALEVNWSKKSEKYFSMTRDSTPTNNGDDDNNYHHANVDCSSLDGENCHAYFIGVPIGSNVISIQEISDEHWGTAGNGGLTPEKDIWKITIETESAKKELPGRNEGIHIETMATTVTESDIELDVCFEYITNTSKADTHYEFLAVNSEGKWKKEIVYKKKDDSHACFYGLELPLADFSESSKFFVILRDSANGKPVSSGEVRFNIPAFRAIKPEVDNGSNGSTSTLSIVGAAIAGIACLMALVAAAVMFVMKMNRDNDGIQYPLHCSNIEDSNVVHGLDNPIPTL